MAWWNPLDNPLAWLAGLGELSSLYSLSRRQRETDRAYQRQRAEYQQAVEERAAERRAELADYQRRQDLLATRERFAQTPVSADLYYRPMADVERAAIERQIKADLISRGLPPDASYTTALAAERMGLTESNRFLAALDYAMRQRGDVLGAMGERASAFRRPPQIGRPLVPTREPFPALGQPGQSAANYMLIRAIERARQGTPPSGQANVPQTAGWRDIAGYTMGPGEAGTGFRTDYGMYGPEDFENTPYPWEDPRGASVPNIIPPLLSKYNY